MDESSKSADPAAEAHVPAELMQAFAAPDDEVAVIIHFREDVAPAPVATRALAIAKLQESLLGQQLPGLSISHRYQHVPALAGRLKQSTLERLKRDPSVASIQLDMPGTGQLKEAVPAIGGDQVRTLYGLSGRGVRVAMLDTGIDRTHPDLRSSLVAEHCFTQYDCPPSKSREGTNAQDDHGHGSNATGIITSDGVVASRGFAPDAEIVAVKVNDQNDSGMESDWIAGLDWVYQNLSTLKVRIVNLSLGTSAAYANDGSCDTKHPGMGRAIKNLIDAGVIVIAASGNSGSTTQMPAPGCLTGPITVGATYDANVGHQPPGTATYWDRWHGAFARCGDDKTAFDQITCFTNANARLDIVAPGAPITSDSLNGRTETYWGTSQAAPAAAGVAALMLQCNPKLVQADVKRIMVSTGVHVTDARTGRAYPSLRALPAVRAACPDLAGADAGTATK